MFCNKCGTELPDGAVFCTNCGSQIGTPVQQETTQQPQTPKETPAIFTNLLNNLKDFFTKKDPVAAVAATAQDKTWSGAIVLGVTLLFFALANMVNFNQLMGFTSASGTVFGFSVLTAVVVAAAAVGMIYLVVKVLCKQEIAIISCVNLAAYAALPMTMVFVVNMLFGLIWGVLPMLMSVLAILASLLLLYSAINDICSLERPAYGKFLLLAAVLVLVGILFEYLTVKNGLKSALSGFFGGFGNFLY